MANDRFARLMGLLISAGAGGFAVGAPDLIGGDLTTPTVWGTVSGTTAYSFGAGHCNVGTSELSVVQASNQHYVFTENLFRYSVVDGSGRFEQIGQGWVFHSFCSLQSAMCSTCAPACAGCCERLGVGCSDTNSASRVGQSSQLGPRWEVNPSTGAFSFPFSSPGAGMLAGRVQVSQAALDPALNPGAAYFAELAEVAPDDAAAGNQDNNASYRRFNVGVLGVNGYPLVVSGATVRQQSAINAWAAQDAGVGSVIHSTNSSVGRFSVASSATPLGGGVWHYEYAVYNMNSDRAGGSFSVPVPAGVTVTNIGFHDVDYHSAGNPYDATDWAWVRNASDVTWQTTSFSVNPNANALRWGTLYNFRFDANTGPALNASVTLGLFKPGTPSDLTIAGMKAPVPPPPTCAGDANADSRIDGADLSVLLGNFNGPAAGPAFGDFNADGQCNGADLSVLLGVFGSAC